MSPLLSIPEGVAMAYSFHAKVKAIGPASDDFEGDIEDDGDEDE